MHIGNYTVDPITILVKRFITEFVMDDHVNNQRGADADRQAQDINSGEYFVTTKTPESRKKIIFEHGYLIADGISPTPVPMAKPAATQGFRKGAWVQVYGNGQFTYIFVHGLILSLMILSD